jgi:hypothetical protein
MLIRGLHALQNGKEDLYACIKLSTVLFEKHRVCGGFGCHRRRKRHAGAADRYGERVARSSPFAVGEAPQRLLSPATQRKAGTGDDDPAAHALYDQMVKAMRQAKSLSYVSHYTFATTRRDYGVLMDCTKTRAW